MGMKLVEHMHVADAAGRRHGRVKRVLRPTPVQLMQFLLGGDEPVTRYVVEWSDRTTTEHVDRELVARFTTQSKEYGKVF